MGLPLVLLNFFFFFYGLESRTNNFLFFFIKGVPNFFLKRIKK